MKKKRVLLSLFLVVAVLTVTISANINKAYAAVSVSTLNGKYILVDSLKFKVLNTGGFAVAITYLGADINWATGLARIQGMGKNKSYIKEARYVTLDEQNTYYSTLPSDEYWLQDPFYLQTDPLSRKGDEFKYFYANQTIFDSYNGLFKTEAWYPHKILPAIIMEPTVTITSGAGTLASPYVLENSYATGSASTSISPALTVIDGQAFNIVVAGGDSIANNSTSDGVTVANTNTSDGYIELSGTLTGIGKQVVTIGGIKFIFKKIAAPSGATVTATFS